MSDTLLVDEFMNDYDDDGDDDDEEGAVALAPTDWVRNSLEENSFVSSLSITRNEMSSFMDPVGENSSFANCRTFQESDNGDLAEADQSRNEEASGHSGAESDSGFVNLQAIEPESNFSLVQNHLTEPESNFSISANKTVESEGNFSNCKPHASDQEETFSLAQSSITEPEGNFFPDSALEPEGDFLRQSENAESSQYQANGSAESGFHLESKNNPPESDTSVQKSGLKYRKWKNESAKSENTVDFKKAPVKNPTNKFRDNTFGQIKTDNSSNDEFEGQRGDSDAASAIEGCARTDSRESVDEPSAFPSLMAFQVCSNLLYYLKN